MMDNSIQIPLDLPDVRVLEVSKTEEGFWLIQVESTLSGTSCRKCGRELTAFHGFDQPIRLRHLPVFEQPVFVELRPKRYQCSDCKGKPTTTQRLSWHELRSPNTKPYEKWLLRFLVNSTVVDIANKLGITESTVTGVLDRWVKTKVNWEQFPRIEILGIDEIALKRGHRDYVVLITTPLKEQGVEVLAVLPDRKKETVAKFLVSIPIKLRKTIERVCTDMYLGFVNAAREQLPRAHIIIDRYTIETWLEPIANYFLERLTSSFVEGFNNRVKVLKRRCYGIFDADRLFQRLTLDLHGYERFSLT